MKNTESGKMFDIDGFFASVINRDPNLRRIPEYDAVGEFKGIQAVTFDSIEYNGKKTKVFAYMAFPDGADESTPGIVLIHGGGGHAFLPWVKMWRDRGYSVIAPDTVGNMPIDINAGCTESNGDWARKLHGVFEEDGYIPSPDNDGMSTYNLDVDRRWLTHITAHCILSFTALAQSGYADKNKIGITGISWGGVAVSYYLGFDSRPAFAIPIYGSGYLNESLAWMGERFSHPETLKYFRAEDRFAKVKMPVMWLCWNDDFCFSINSNSKSYLDTAPNNPLTTLSIVDCMCHSHNFAWIRPESEAFANSIVKGGDALQSFTSLPNGKSPVCTYAYSKEVTARLYYIIDELEYSMHEKHGMNNTFLNPVWQSVPLNAENGTITGDIPCDACGYYIEIKNEDGVIITTPYIKTER